MRPWLILLLIAAAGLAALFLLFPHQPNPAILLLTWSGLLLLSALLILNQNQARTAALSRTMAEKTAALEQRNRQLQAEILERKQAEEALRDSEARFRLLAENARDIIYRYQFKPEPGFSYVSPAAAAVTGYTPADHYADPALGFKLVHPDDRHLLENMDGEKIDLDQPLLLRWVRKDGTIIWTEQHNTFIYNTEGDLVALEGIARDVTQRQQTEEALRVANRALRVLSEGNQALIRATSEPELLGEVCRVIVEEGGYRLAWIGFAETDEAKSVRPVAQAGFEEGYLDTMKLSWADTDRGRGPTGAAIRTGKPAITKNITADPAYAPWREEASRRGYASSISLPLLNEGQPVGALNIYAAEPDAFAPAEVKLLAELANDLAYGLRALRTRAKKEQAEKALLESQARLKLTIQGAAVGLWDWNLHTNTVYFSPEWKSQLRYAEDELSNDFSEWQSRVHPDDLERALARIQAYLQQPWPNFENEFRLRHKDGSYRWILARASLLRDDNGQPVRMLGSHIDITGRKETEEALRLSEARYADLYENAPDMYASVEAATGQIIQCNQTLAEMTGFRKEEIIGRPLFERYHPDSLAAAQKAFHAFVTTGQVRDAELQLRCKDDRWLDVSLNVSAVRDEAGHIRYSRSIWRDITARKQADETLRRYNQRLESLHAIDRAILAAQSPAQIAEAALQVLLHLIPCQRISLGVYDESANAAVVLAAAAQDRHFLPAASRISLQGMEPVITQLKQNQVVIQELVPAENSPPLTQLLRGQGIHMQVTVPLMAAGQLIGSLNLSFSRPGSFTAEQEDMTREVAAQLAIAIRHAQLYEQTQRHAEELEQRVASRTAELKDYYQRQAALEERQRLARDLHDAVSQTLFSAALLAEALPRLWERYPEQARQSLLELQRLNRGALAEMRNLLLELRPSALTEADLADLMRYLRDGLAGRTSLTISLEIRGEPQLPPDPKLALYRIAQEALNNIVKHAQAGRVIIQLSGRPDQVSLTIRDDGRGFDPQQTPAGRLGLTIMRERAEAAGAALRIHSQPGQGTAITVSWSAAGLPDGSVSITMDVDNSTEEKYE